MHSSFAPATTVHLRDSITRNYVLALCAIAATVIAGFMLLHGLIRDSASDSQLINTAGAQRMLSQRISMLAQDLVQTRDAETARLLAQAIDTMAKGHETLTQSQGAAAHSTPLLAAHYFAGPIALDQRVTAFLQTARALLAGPADPLATAQMAVARAEAMGPLLADLNSAVLLYDAASRARIARLEMLHLALTAFALLLLAAEAALIFRPLARRLHGQTMALTDQLALSRTILDVIPAGLAVWSASDLRLVQANPAFADMTGSDTQAGTVLPDVLVHADPGQDVTLLGGTNPPRVGRVSTRDVATSGASAYRVTLIEDQTADRRREAAMSDALAAACAASDAKARFTASVSHEIRTPLNGIIGMLDLMALDRLSVDQAQRLQTARASSDHLLDILNDILDAASLEAGTFEIRYSDAPLVPLLTGTLAAFEGRAAAKGIALASTIDVAVPAMLHTDPRRLRQILSNLIGNAIKFTFKGEVGLHATVQGGMLHCAITDTGPGIAPDDLGKLFARFVQLDNSSTRLHQGTGLGLAISQELTTALGGTIGVTSTLGQGTTFWFTHPLASPVARPLHISPRRPLEIMIADDNKTNRLVARKMLETLGHRVTEAADGAQAVALGLQMTSDIILMDWQMPGMDGLEATRQLVAANHLPRFGIIALTAHAGTSHRDTCLAAGMRGVLAKPLRLGDLQAALDAAVMDNTDDGGL